MKGNLSILSALIIRLEAIIPLYKFLCRFDDLFAKKGIISKKNHVWHWKVLNCFNSIPGELLICYPWIIDYGY